LQGNARVSHYGDCIANKVILDVKFCHFAKIRRCQCKCTAELFALILWAHAMSLPCKPTGTFCYFNSSPEVIRLAVMMYVHLLL
jgi:hypothetical protein